MTAPHPHGATNAGSGEESPQPSPRSELSRTDAADRAEIADYVDSVLDGRAFASSGAEVADWLYRHFEITRKAS